MSITEEQLYWAWLQKVPGVGPRMMAQLTAQAGSPGEIFLLAKQGGEALSFLSAKVRNALRSAATDQALEDCARMLERYNIRMVMLESREYPELLRHIYSPPPVLYLRGQGSLLQLKNAVSIVGSRKCSSYGGELARQFGRELARRNITVVSGMALGIDAQAHWGAIEGGGTLPTVAVLACGVEQANPASHYSLYEAIMEKGLVLSELPPGTPPRAGNYPIRNRIIAGLSQGTLVVEAGLKSGTWHTVDHALDSGREVFALPGRIGEPCSAGTLEMIKLGAKPVTDINGILEEFPSWGAELRQEPREAGQLSLEESLVLETLVGREMSADELFESTRLAVHRLLSLLTKLTQKGIIKRTSQMRYRIADTIQ